jgi:Na+/melibiose symporter-like transporter
VSQSRLGLATRFAYGSGGISTAVKDAAVVHFLLVFYTQVAGLPGWWFWIAAAIGQIADAIVDPAIGTWSDNLRSRWGRRHPFMLAAALPYAAAFVLLFNPPSGLSDPALFAWAAATMVATRALLALFAIPHTALGAELSTDYAERTRIAGDRTVLAWLGGILLPALAYQAIFHGTGADGRLVAANYPTYALLSAGVIVFTTLASSFGTWREIPRIPVPRERRTLKPLDPFRDVLFALRNANFRRVFLALFIAGGITGVSTMFNALTWLYFWEFDTSQTSFLTLSSLAPTLLAFAVIGPLSQRFEKRALYGGTMAVLIASVLWFPSARLLGLLPANGTPAILVLALLTNFVTVLVLVLNGSVWPSIIADIADEYEVDHGERKDGVFFAALAFGLKLPQGLGNVLGGFLVAWVGIEKGMMAGAVPADALFRLGFVAGPIVALSLVLPVLAMSRYDITRERHAGLRREIEARAAALPPPPAEGPALRAPETSPSRAG